MNGDTAPVETGIRAVEGSAGKEKPRDPPLTEVIVCIPRVML